MAQAVTEVVAKQAPHLVSCACTSFEAYDKPNPADGHAKDITGDTGSTRFAFKDKAVAQHVFGPGQGGIVEVTLTGGPDLGRQFDHVTFAVKLHQPGNHPGNGAPAWRDQSFLTITVKLPYSKPVSLFYRDKDLDTLELSLQRSSGSGGTPVHKSLSLKADGQEQIAPGVSVSWQLRPFTEGIESLGDAEDRPHLPLVENVLHFLKDHAKGADADQQDKVQKEVEDTRKDTEAAAADGAGGAARAAPASDHWQWLRKEFCKGVKKVAVLYHPELDTKVLFHREAPSGRLRVTFRGTVSPKNWKTDGELVPTELGDLTPVKSSTAAKGPVRIHSGFRDAYLNVRYQLWGVLKALVDHSGEQHAAADGAAGNGNSGNKPPTTEVLVTGHSLGGALATLAAHDLATNKEDWGLKCNVKSYTYGSPRVGNEHFMNDYNAKVPDTWRVTKPEDVVTWVPRGLQEMYLHVGRHWDLDHQPKKADEAADVGKAADEGGKRKTLHLWNAGDVPKGVEAHLGYDKHLVEALKLQPAADSVAA